MRRVGRMHMIGYNISWFHTSQCQSSVPIEALQIWHPYLLRSATTLIALILQITRRSLPPDPPSLYTAVPFGTVRAVVVLEPLQPEY